MPWLRGKKFFIQQDGPHTRPHTASGTISDLEKAGTGEGWTPDNNYTAYKLAGRQRQRFEILSFSEDPRQAKFFSLDSRDGKRAKDF